MSADLSVPVRRQGRRPCVRAGTGAGLCSGPRGRTAHALPRAPVDVVPHVAAVRHRVDLDAREGAQRELHPAAPPVRAARGPVVPCVAAPRVFCQASVAGRGWHRSAAQGVECMGSSATRPGRAPGPIWATAPSPTRIVNDESAWNTTPWDQS